SRDGTLVAVGAAGGFAVTEVDSNRRPLRVQIRGPGWFSLDAEDRYRGSPDALRDLYYVEPADEGIRPILWCAEDLPERRAPDDDETSGVPPAPTARPRAPAKRRRRP